MLNCCADHSLIHVNTKQGMPQNSSKCLKEVSNAVDLHKVVHGGALWNGATACRFLQLQTLLESMLCVREREKR